MTRSNVPLWERPTLRHHDPRYGYVSVSDEYVAEVREHYRDIVRRIDALGVDLRVLLGPAAEEDAVRQGAGEHRGDEDAAERGEVGFRFGGREVVVEALSVGVTAEVVGAPLLARLRHDGRRGHGRALDAGAAQRRPDPVHDPERAAPEVRVAKRVLGRHVVDQAVTGGRLSRRRGTPGPAAGCARGLRAPYPPRARAGPRRGP